ncbi:hypothetical protein [Kordiimonas sediminis]|uniref:hypothetical protein n=1 Tax=Kordiimonas sediminis TaxID=1735581 RepID=UPI00174ACDE0|nr:hypothetical protein [Kordiimonas sediminis]
MSTLSNIKALCSVNTRLRLFWNYFETLSGNWQTLPIEKSAFNPMDVAPCLTGVVLTETNMPDEVTLRLIGSDMEILFGRGATGKNVLTLVSEKEAPGVRWFYKSLYDKPSISYQDSILELETGKGIRTKTLGFPLWNKNGAPVYRITCSVYERADWRNLQHKASDAVVQHHLINKILFADIGYGAPDDVIPPA